MQLNAPQIALRWQWVSINWLMIYVPAKVMPASVFAALHSRAPEQSSTSGTECHTVLVGSRVQLQKRLSQPALDLVASPASQAYVER